MRRTETPKPIWIKFCMVVDISDIVTYTNFGDHQLRGFWVAGSQISPSPVDFHRRPYNTLALPCECVMAASHWLGHRKLHILTGIGYQALDQQQPVVCTLLAVRLKLCWHYAHHSPFVTQLIKSNVSAQVHMHSRNAVRAYCERLHCFWLIWPQ